MTLALRQRVRHALTIKVTWVVNDCVLSLGPRQEEYHALRDQQESDSQFKNSKEGGYTSQGWTHIPLVNAREPEEFYALQRARFPKTMKVPPFCAAEVRYS